MVILYWLHPQIKTSLIRPDQFNSLLHGSGGDYFCEIGKGKWVGPLDVDFCGGVSTFILLQLTSGKTTTEEEDCILSLCMIAPSEQFANLTSNEEPYQNECTLSMLKACNLAPYIFHCLPCLN